MKIGRLFVGVSDTNEDRRKVVASWQHRDGYWRWHVSWYPKAKRHALLTGGYVGGHFTPGGWDSVWRGLFNGHFSAYGWLPMVGGWGFSTQPPFPR